MEKPDKRRKYDAAFKAEALRLTSESPSTQAAVRALNIDPKLLCKWQQDTLPTLPAGPSEATEVRQLRAANKHLVQELEIKKKPSSSSVSRRPCEALPVLLTSIGLAIPYGCFARCLALRLVATTPRACA
jgi:transposase